VTRRRLNVTDRRFRVPAGPRVAKKIVQSDRFRKHLDR